MPILGLVSTEDYSSNRFKNVRRSVFYFYPNGAAPLTGLLSLMDEEDTDDPEFSWWEKRLSKQRDTTKTQGSSLGPFQNNVGSAMSDPFTWTADTLYRVFTTTDQTGTSAVMRKGHVIKIVCDKDGGDADSLELRGVITDIAATYLTVRAINTVASVKNGATNENADKEILIIGSAFAQGRDSVKEEVYSQPKEFTNFTQIFRTPFSITGTALRTSVKYDETGPYKDKAKEHSVQHMIEMEKAFLFGSKNKYYSAATVNPTDGTGLPTYTTGGILHFLEKWEAGDYETVTATKDADDDKRIILNTAGSINEKDYDKYLERCFRVTNNTANEKLVLCGSGFLSVINQMYRSKSVLNSDLPMTDTYGMNVVKHLTPFGTIYYKSHPLFSQNPVLRNNALFVDVKNLKYRIMQGRDTELLKNRQPNDADYRRDEWFTEAGLELRFPESFMYLQNVKDFTP